MLCPERPNPFEKPTPKGPRVKVAPKTSSGAAF